MITGACNAARQESTRLSRMYGYGSNGLRRAAEVLRAIQATSTAAKLRMNLQLPPNPATRSATRSPSVICESDSTLRFSETSSCSRRLFTTSSSSEDSSPICVSSAFATYRARKRLRQDRQTTFWSDHSGWAPWITLQSGSLTRSPWMISRGRLGSRQIGHWTGGVELRLIERPPIDAGVRPDVDYAAGARPRRSQ